MDALIRQIESAFTERVMTAEVSYRFKLPPKLGVYEENMDPMDHLDSYKNLNARLLQHLAMNNSAHATALIPKDSNRSRHSH